MSLFDSSHDKKQDFNLEVVLTHFKNSLHASDNVSLGDYLMAFHELCRFFKLTGPLFAFVAKDLEYKIKSIEHYLQSTNGEFYQNVHSMAAYETERGAAHNRWPRASGCRSLIRLHWALEFILAFMKRLMDEDDNARASTLAWEVYTSTLAKHHPWITQKLAAVAVHALPSKKRLIDVMCKQEMDRVVELVAEVLDAANPVYRRVDEILQDFALLDTS